MMKRSTKHTGTNSNKTTEKEAKMKPDYNKKNPSNRRPKAARHGRSAAPTLPQARRDAPVANGGGGGFVGFGDSGLGFRVWGLGFRI